MLEWPMQFGRLDSEYMYLSSLHWLPLVNGYSGYRPPSNPRRSSYPSTPTTDVTSANPRPLCRPSVRALSLRQNGSWR